jgi:hypothetical protein
MMQNVKETPIPDARRDFGYEVALKCNQCGAIRRVLVDTRQIDTFRKTASYLSCRERP